MPNYQNGKIYTIRCRTDNNLIYVGSTVETLSIRLAKHRYQSKKKPHYKLYQTINDNWNNWYIELFEVQPCDSKEELLKREGEVIREIGTLNTVICGRTLKEYYHDNKENIAEKHKEYYHDNKEKLTEKQKKYYHDNKENITGKQKEYRENNKEKHKEYREKNKEKIAEKDKEYWEKNKEKRREQQKEWCLKNKEKIKEYMRQYHLNKNLA